MIGVVSRKEGMNKLDSGGGRVERSLKTIRSMPVDVRIPKMGREGFSVGNGFEEVRNGERNGGDWGQADVDSPYGLNEEIEEEEEAATMRGVPLMDHQSWSDRSVYGLKKFWYQFPNGDWQLGKAYSQSEKESILLLPDGNMIKVLTESLLPANPDILQAVDDLLQLSYLNEPAVLYNLQCRYSRDMIYSKGGPVLVAMNPFKTVPLYGNGQIEAYKRKRVHRPHVYAIADTAMREMIRDEVSQSIIISGESGAGKTETAKIAMQYLAALAGGSGIEYEILQTNPILEAFGNAKTLRNNNSSRFGKLIEIHFNSNGKICGAKIDTFLLEKSRVVQCAREERSYHIFYQLCAGATPSLREKLGLRNANEYNYLKQSGCFTINGVDDSQMFRIVLDALHAVHVSKEDQDNAFAMVAAVLWLGNISFRVVDDENHVEVVEDEGVEYVAKLMQCSISHLKSSLMARKMRVSNENIVQKLTLVQAIDARDALAKSIYARLFDWLVEQINLSLQVGKRRTGRSISILDIYGFESFQKNSFEQFCINYANERLQQHFNRHLFKLEQEEYIKDGIDWTRVDFEDNQECLNLFENKPLGLLSLLNEESTFPNGTDLTFANKLKQHLSSNGCFRGDRGETFGVRHYAGEVMYDSSGFLEKNRDLLHLDSIELLSSCLSKLPKAFAEQMLDQSGKVLGQQNRSVGAEFQKLSVATKFKAQLFRLMQRLEKTTPHFIRCIKPNNRQLPGIYEQDLVLQQLRCCGVLEVVRISRSGYPTRISHQKFARRYGFLLLDNIAAQDPLTVSVSILNQFNILPDMYQVGFTKLFFRTGQIGVLEDTRNRTLHAILGVQKLFRGHRARRYFKELKKRAIMFQSIIRGEMSRREYEALIQKHRAARVLQHYLKQSIARKRFLMMRNASVLIQSGIRGWLVRRNSSVPIVRKSNTSVDKLQVVDADHILVRVSEMQELQERVVRAEAELREKEEENDILRQRLHRYETRWSGYEIKMKSMEETWQKQMTSLRSSLTTAKRSLANDTSNRVSDASSTHAGENEEDLVQWNSFSYAERRMGGSRSLCFDREMSTGLSVINQLAKVLEQRTQVFDDDVKFLEEVKSGKAVAELDVDDELKKLKRDFKLWKKEFSTSLRKTKTVLQKLGSEDGQDRIKKRWWSKRGNSSRTLA